MIVPNAYTVLEILLHVLYVMLTEEPDPVVLRPSDVDTSSVHGLVLDQDLIRFESVLSALHCMMI